MGVRVLKLEKGVLDCHMVYFKSNRILKIFNYNFIYDFHTIYKKLMIKLYSQKKILWILMFYQVGSNFLMYLTQMRILNFRNFFKVQTNKKNYCVSNMRTLNYCFSALILFQLTIKRQNSIKLRIVNLMIIVCKLVIYWYILKKYDYPD